MKDGFDDFGIKIGEKVGLDDLVEVTFDVG